ncbi:unnamed protein product [Symbiodinium necroappetens]|uniref:Metalloendopeptidase n=1 Tax=Symbiodinium necroappetens TaxID=1628268 RepID=A0A813AFQ3_9DINO|nr:unnamed protein product [Symbiodinium necroappetens]|mmetsp:Transcript_20309/g.48165  ORF Transcript_20309/g.48165 Transcript_20309/m.48165 type:complete len:539 (-) Transcript_20309:190-1806(-)
MRPCIWFVLGWHVTNAHDDIALLQIVGSTRSKRSALASWVAGPWGDCLAACGGGPVQVRKSKCRSLTTGEMLASDKCPYAAPEPLRSCNCELMVCSSSTVDCPARQSSWLPYPGNDDDADFEQIGCMANEVKDGEPRVRGQPPLDWSCRFASSTCRQGLPFYSMASNAQSPSLCFAFCIEKGMDIFGIVGADECRCGASVLNTAIIRPDEEVALSFAFDPDRLRPRDPSDCDVKFYRYIGFYEDGAVPKSRTNILQSDLSYVTLMTRKRDSDQMEEDLPVKLRDLLLLPARQREGLSQQEVQELPGWMRKCWPHNCASGAGLWSNRTTALSGEGISQQWKSHVVVPYVFDERLDGGRKEVFRAACQAYMSKTCILFMEHSKPPNQTYASVGVDDYTSCYSAFIGAADNSRMNLGWCSSSRELGSVMHELGHLLGMEHEQKRPDSQKKYFGKGPYLVMKWENVAPGWEYQWEVDSNAYTGDNESGYAPYDFESLMHYAPVYDEFDTIPASAKMLVGNRKHLSDLDLQQLLAMYKCERRA